MIIARLCGGLGNQMFQYATARAVAYRTGLPLKFDITQFRKDKVVHFYSLNCFNISGTFATSQEIQSLNPPRWKIGTVLCCKIKERKVPWYRKNLIKEPDFAYNPDILKINKSSYLVGYWQSEKYFKDIAPIIRNEFTFKKKPDGTRYEIMKKINSINSVSLHVRRGDYMTNPKFAVLDLDYYERAINLILIKVSKPEIFVFSDDIPWVKNNLKIPLPLHYISNNGTTKDYEDLQMMKECRYHIIANSSFSWWAAWLAEYSQKIVIAPNKWFNINKNTKDLIPEGWFRL